MFVSLMMATGRSKVDTPPPVTFDQPSTMIGYKVAKNAEGNCVVVTLEIPGDALTNMERSSVAFRETAKHRANKAKVVAIEDQLGTSYTTATSFNYQHKSLTYTVGEMVEEPSYNPDPDQVCAKGIHFFLTRHVAELYDLTKVENGLYQKWHDNGQKWEEVTYLDGKRHGLYQSWHDNGQKHVEDTYVVGKLHGLFQGWFSNGQKHVEETYVDGKPHGLFQGWFSNGQKHVEDTYVDGKLHGLYQEWHDNGQKWEEVTYLDGKRHGLYQKWHDNGQKEVEATYVDGKLNGLYRHWEEDGTLLEEVTYEHGVKV